jgi:hypothetical protein
MFTNQEFVVSQSDPTKVRIAESIVRETQVNEILVRIERFGFTSNNITYVALGKKFQYFDFFPVGKEEANPPVWGVATVVDSLCNTVEVGERIYGYFPMAKYYHLTPISVRPSHFYVSRPQLPADRAVYHQYFRSKHDPDYALNQEDHMMIFRPLWGTSFFLDDFLQFEKYFGVNTILVSSASSKTAYCFALLLKGKGKKVLGLTSKGNVPFVTSLQLYDQVVAYDDLNHVPLNEKILYIDVAGNPKLDTRIFERVGDNIVKRVSVGMSHFDGSTATFGNEVRKKSVNFFAPDWIKKRFEISKGDVVERRIKAWQELLEYAKQCVQLSYIVGSSGVQKVYLDMLEGKAKPDSGFILSFFPSPSKL